MSDVAIHDFTHTSRFIREVISSLTNIKHMTLLNCLPLKAVKYFEKISFFFNEIPLSDMNHIKCKQLSLVYNQQISI